MNAMKLTISMPSELLRKVDQRAAELGLKRSQYLAQLIRSDLLGDEQSFQIAVEGKQKYGVQYRRPLVPEPAKKARD